MTRIIHNGRDPAKREDDFFLGATPPAANWKHFGYQNKETYFQGGGWKEPTNNKYDSVRFRDVFGSFLNVSFVRYFLGKKKTPYCEQPSSSSRSLLCSPSFSGRDIRGEPVQRFYCLALGTLAVSYSSFFFLKNRPEEPLLRAFIDVNVCGWRLNCATREIITRMITVFHCTRPFFFFIMIVRLELEGRKDPLKLN